MWGWGWKVWDRSQSAGCMWWQYVQCTVYCTLYSGQCTGCTVPGQSVLACHARRSALQHCCMLPAVTYCSLQTDQHRDISRQLWMSNSGSVIVMMAEVLADWSAMQLWSSVRWLVDKFLIPVRRHRLQTTEWVLPGAGAGDTSVTANLVQTLDPASLPSVIPGYYHKC